mgnify:CR=1 FL=1
MKFPDIVLRLPGWVEGFVCGVDASRFGSVEGRMGFVVELADLNVRHGTGGPFGAGVFEIGTGELLAVGVNVVSPSNCSAAHAEIMALSLAQKMAGSYSLSLGEKRYELVTSVEPCAMCMGAVHWAGIGRVVCGARDADAGEFGFDEGPKPENWVERFENSGIEVVRDVLRPEAAGVLRRYAEGGGEIYNGDRFEGDR